MRSDLIDRMGERYGTLLVIGYAGSRKWASSYQQSVWQIRCDCGYEGEVLTGPLRRGQKTHKGCPLIPKFDSAASQRRVQARRKERGVCIRCTVKAEPGKTRCARHLEIARTDEARRKERQRINGG